MYITIHKRFILFCDSFWLLSQHIKASKTNSLQLINIFQE